MRVLHINLAKGWRGGERQTLLLMEGLRELGVESVLLARPGEPLAERAGMGGFRVVTPAPPLVLRWNLARQFDLIHAHEARALQLAAVWKLMVRTPLVATRRVDFSPSRGFPTRFKYAQTDRIVAISNGVREVMARWGAGEEKLDIIHSAVPLHDQSRPERAVELRARFAGHRTIGCVAALVGHKDHATLLRAAARLQASHPNVRVVLVGDGELRSALEAQARDLGLRNVVFEGYQTDPYSYFRLFDVFVMTSREEGLGTSILDAFAYGVPVIATRAGGIPEMVKDGESGLLVDVGDDKAVAFALGSVLNDAQLGRRLVEGGRARIAADFSIASMAARYRALYEDLLKDRTGGSAG